MNKTIVILIIILFGFLFNVPKLINIEKINSIVPQTGIEPVLAFSEQDFKSCVSTNSTTLIFFYKDMSKT